MRRWLSIFCVTSLLFAANTANAPIIRVSNGATTLATIPAGLINIKAGSGATGTWSASTHTFTISLSGSTSGGIAVMTTGAADPDGAGADACAAPDATNFALYTQTTSQDIWMCVATNTWKKILSTTNVGTYTVTGTEGSAASTPASGSLVCWYDSTAHNQLCKDSSGNVYVSVKTAGSRTANQFAVYVNANGVIQTAAIVAADLSAALANSTSVNGTTIPSGGVTLTKTVASGAKALGTSNISSGACATVATDTATGAVSTDIISWAPNASIKAVTGYSPSTNGGLSIAAYPTADTVNFDVCNWTASTIAPGAITLNWRVTR